MKILVVTNCPPVEYLGSGYIIKNFSEGLRSLGHEVDIFGPEHFPFMNWMAPRANQYRTMIGMYYFTKRQIKKKNYDIIEFYGGECVLAVKKLVRQNKRKFIVIHHSNGPEPKYDDIMRNLNPSEFKWYHIKRTQLLQKAFSLPDGIITISKDDEKWLIENGLPNTKLRKTILPCLPNTLLNLNIDFEKKEKVFGYCGTWLPKKGIKIMQHDIPPILRKFPDWKFRIIGQEKGFYPNKYFPTDVLPQIEIVPFIKEKEKLIEEYKKLSIFILPSLIESFGLVMAEAMACGCATVVTKVGYAFSLKDKKDAIVMPEKNTPHLYNALEKLITDQAFRTKIAIQGYQKVQDLEWGKKIKLLEDTYKKWQEKIIVS